LLISSVQIICPWKLKATTYFCFGRLNHVNKTYHGQIVTSKVTKTNAAGEKRVSACERSHASRFVLTWGDWKLVCAYTAADEKFLINFWKSLCVCIQERASGGGLFLALLVDGGSVRCDIEAVYTTLSTIEAPTHHIPKWASLPFHGWFMAAALPKQATLKAGKMCLDPP
jgi:hypothetical protein